MDQVDTLHGDWSEVLCCTIMAHLGDLEANVMDLYCVYTMFPAAPAAPFARNVACRGVLVIHFSDFQDLLRFVTFSYTAFTLCSRRPRQPRLLET